MAYSKPLPTCYAVNCHRSAVYEVYDRWNQKHGSYCVLCAKKKLTELLKMEAEDHAKRPR